jgi:hypothetical protein
MLNVCPSVRKIQEFGSVDCGNFMQFNDVVYFFYSTDYQKLSTRDT